MKCIVGNEIIDIYESDFIGSGKEARAYRIGESAVKIFLPTRSPGLLDEQGFSYLQELSSEVGTTVSDLVYDLDYNFIGYSLPYFSNMDVNEMLDLSYNDLFRQLDSLHYKIIKLSECGVLMRDIYHNYIYHNGIQFIDYGSFQIHPNAKEVPFLKQMIYQENLRQINNLLVGIFIFDYFRDEEEDDRVLFYQLNEYRNRKCGDDLYFGNVLRMIFQKHGGETIQDIKKYVKL